jgi:hypothetical protein
MANKKNPSGLISSMKFFVVSLSLTGAVWLWSVFANQALQSNGMKVTNPGSAQPQAAQNPGAQALPGTNTPSGTSSSNVAVQPVIVVPSSPVTSTGSSR